MDLYAHLTNEIGLTQEQAEGAAGALLQLAQARMVRQEFQIIADAIPAVSDVIGKAPRFEVPPRRRLKARLSRMLGGLGELTPLVEPLGRLQIDKQLIPRCAESLLKYFEQEKTVDTTVLLAKAWS